MILYILSTKNSNFKIVTINGEKLSHGLFTKIDVEPPRILIVSVFFSQFLKEMSDFEIVLRREEELI
jgi:hypothetical protein